MQSSIASDKFYAGHCFTSSGECSPTQIWRLDTNHSSNQMELTGLVQYITHRCRCRVPRPVAILHPWQAEPPLPAIVTIDFSHHHPQSLPAPAGWEIIQCNGQVWMVEQNNRVTRIADRHSTKLHASRDFRCSAGTCRPDHSVSRQHQ